MQSTLVQRLDFVAFDSRLKTKEDLPRFMLCHLYFYQAFARKQLQQLCSLPFPSFEEFLLFSRLQSSETRVQLWRLHYARGTVLLGISLWDKYGQHLSILYPKIMSVTGNRVLKTLQQSALKLVSLSRTLLGKAGCIVHWSSKSMNTLKLTEIQSITCIT